MTVRFLLVRHAPHAELGRVLTGRDNGVALGASGRREAALLAKRLAHIPIDALLSSPRARTRQTAQAITATQTSLAVQISDALDEVDFGDWSGRSFDELQRDPLWQQWNAARSATRAPGGETMGEVQQRALGLIHSLARAPSGTTIALVTHAEVIRAVACHTLQLSLDAWQQIEIAPASVSTLMLAGGRLRFLGRVPGSS
jgi:broad specificity phosphatase PhoE